MPSLGPLPRSHAAVRELLGQLPAAPGVYLFHDRAGHLLYVGKSICLRDRVRSYFGETAGKYPKLRRLRSRARAVEWRETGSELEALLLESHLVKTRHPPFNALLQRYRYVCFLRLDPADPFPRLEVTDRLRRDGARYFGPFTLSADAVRLADILSDTLRLRTCDPPGSRVHRLPPCLRRDLGLCHAPCHRPTDVRAYAASVQEMVGAFDRDGLPFRERLRAEMADAAERLLFERAARLRDALRSLEGLAGRQQAVLSAVDSLDVVAACPSRLTTDLELFLFSSGSFLAQSCLARDSLVDPESALETARSLLRRRDEAACAMGGDVEPEILDQLFIISRWLRQNSGEGRHFLLPRDEETNFLALRLGAWLRDLATSVGAPSAGTVSASVEAGTLTEWVETPVYDAPGAPR
jgi:excinuclease UvrABC nuclease subunit